jgi:thiol-disulfide isomerase/thioredoxin
MANEGVMRIFGRFFVTNFQNIVILVTFFGPWLKYCRAISAVKPLRIITSEQFEYSENARRNSESVNKSVYKERNTSTLFHIAAQYETMPELANNVTSFR